MKKQFLCISFILFSNLSFGIKHFILISAPGSGKGTFCQYLVKKYGYEQICPGDIFRKEIELGTSLGKRIQPIVERGEYVNKKIVCKLVKKYISKILQNNNNFILDGFPRAESSYTFLRSLLKRHNIEKKVCFLQFVAKDSICTKRILGRLVCTNCSKVYNTKHHKSNACDQCYSSLSRRSADTKEIAKKRLQYFHENIEPLIKRAQLDYEVKKVQTKCSLNTLENFYEKLLQE